MSEHAPEKPVTHITYAVEYQTTDSKSDDDWYVMDGRDFNKKFLNPGAIGPLSETASMDEAVDTAEALVNRRAYPQDPTSRYYRRVTKSRVIVRVYTGHIAAVYEAR